MSLDKLSADNFTRRPMITSFQDPLACALNCTHHSIRRLCYPEKLEKRSRLIEGGPLY